MSLDKLDDSAPFNDDQGTKVGRPTDAGSEATRGTDGRPAKGAHEHESGYGGNAGEPKVSNDGESEGKKSRG